MNRRDLPNIFLLSTSLAEEDRFTSSLHYLIDCIPELGQGMVDAILGASKEPSSLFGQAVDHPNAVGESRPDFVLKCEDFDIICEHKIDSDLGERQLERYLEMPWERPAYLALISQRRCTVTEEVVNHSKYLRPTEARHYQWRDLYATLSSSVTRLCRDFATYMQSLGMQPLQLPNGWDDLLTNRATADCFGQQFQAVRDYFDAQGFRSRIDPSRLGLQISRSDSWLRLLYLFVKPTSGVQDSRVEGSVLGARIYVPVREQFSPEFGQPEPQLMIGASSLSAMPRKALVPWDREPQLVYEYHTSLGPFLSDDTEAIRAGLREFATGVFQHASKLVGLPVAAIN